MVVGLVKEGRRLRRWSRENDLSRERYIKADHTQIRLPSSPGEGSGKAANPCSTRTNRVSSSSTPVWIREVLSLL